MIGDEKPTLEFWGVKTLSMSEAAFCDLNQRIVALRLIMDRQAPPWLKMSRRSRRRWRGRGGVHVYPPHLIKAGHDTGLFRRLNIESL